MLSITKALRIVKLLSLFSLATAQFRLYHTEHPIDHGDHMCIYRYAKEFEGRAHHLIPYCLRASMGREIETNLPCYGENLTFVELNRSNITADRLMAWLTPMDSISTYQEYLISGLEGEQWFCNCSEHSFGSRCQYHFVVNTTSFNELIDSTFAGRKLQRDIRTVTEENAVTCYLLFNCTPYMGFCLDWRQICDGRVDCLYGNDEARCLEKELNECDAKTQYRCLSGHCIPKAFSFDLTTDCPNWDDEQDLFVTKTESQCELSALAECEEHACGLSQYSCGDGKCFPEIKFYHVLRKGQCNSLRSALLIKRIYDFREGISEICWRHMVCSFGFSCLFEQVNVSNSSCRDNDDRIARFCYELSNDSIPCSVNEDFFLPMLSTVYPFTQLLYKWKPFVPHTHGFSLDLEPTMICYNASLCTIKNLQSNYSSRIIHGYTCYAPQAFSIFDWPTIFAGVKHPTLILTTIQRIFSHCSYTPIHSDLFTCQNGLQISFHRLQDGNLDCYPSKEDELLPKTLYKCTQPDRLHCFETLDRHRCLPKRFVHDNTLHCWNSLDEQFPAGCTFEYDCHFYRNFDLSKQFPIVYEELCNGLIMERLSGSVEDETDCDAWPCHTRTHRCDGVWNRLNGCDELDCPNLIPTYISRLVANCSINEHYCLHSDQFTLTCLSLAQAGNHHIDCLFAMDERLTPNISFTMWIPHQGRYRRENLGTCRQSNRRVPSSKDLCDRRISCPSKDDELFCPWHLRSNCSSQQFTCQNGTCLPKAKQCNNQIDCWPEAEDEWACDLFNIKSTAIYQPFTLEGFNTESADKQTDLTASQIDDDKVELPQSKIINIDLDAVFQCHRGILLRSKDDNNVCICPPSYYGVRCQYQSSRLSITFRSELPPTFDRNTIYHLIFLLHDDNYQIYSLSTLFYIPSKYLTDKHLIHLVYPRRIEQLVKSNLFVHIEAYIVTPSEVQSVFIAWYYPVLFSFLPVNRLAVKLDLEPSPLNKTLCHHLGCIHGQCMSYVNNRYKHFCSCDQGWTSFRCNQRLAIDPCLELNCDNAHSKCVVHGNRAVCLCTLGRIGHNCHVPYNACEGIRCENGGQCISLDEHSLKRVCLCSINYFGDRCQFVIAQLTIQMCPMVEFIPAMIVHFLHTPKNIPGVLSHRNTYFFRNIHPDTQIIIHDFQQQFLPSIIMIQTYVDRFSDYGHYYLLSLLDHNRTTLTKTFDLTNRCLHVSERLDDKLMNLTWIARVKHYHIYFKDVRCFFDEIYMCLVDRYQLIDCLIFNHQVAHCNERNYCANAGRCLENKQFGQVQFACVCPECYHGVFCQLTMTQYSLTLDSIYGQEILTDASFSQQTFFIKITLVLIVLMFVVGTISNICSIVTFSHKYIRRTGCGSYLFALSIVSQISLAIVLGRFISLLVSQMNILSDKLFLKTSCMFLDFLLQLSISFCDWLSACVASERTISVIKKVHFNKVLSVRMAKLVIPSLLIGLILISIHQIFIRELIIDPRSDERLWCVVKFPTVWLQTHHSVMNFLSNIVPFSVNLLSGLILLVVLSRTKQKATKQKNYRAVLKEQLALHNDLILSPTIMISCKLPMIIIILTIKCIKLQWQLYLAAACYFLAMVPLTATAFVFILPSPTFTRIFKEQWKKMHKKRSR